VKHVHLAVLTIAACLAGAGETYAAAADSVDRADPYAQPGYGRGYGRPGGQGYGDQGYGGQGYRQQPAPAYQQPRYAPPRHVQPRYAQPEYAPRYAPQPRYVQPEYAPPRPYYRQGRYASTCLTSRGACPDRPAPPYSPCGCDIPGFGYKRGATTY
jgi:hypothetical protein